MIGFHFFNPVHRMPLLEIIVTPKTSQKTTDEALQLAHRLGKLPIVVKDGPGFVVNRILLAYLAEAGRLLEETGQLDLLDKVMLDFGLPMGPLQLSDEVGMDVGLKVLRILADALGPRFEPVQVFEKLVEREWLGKKTGQGFYVYRKPSMPWQRRAVVNAKVSSFLPKNRGALVEEIALDRMLLLMINEAAYCLQDQIADDPHSIDAGMIFGCGFPPFSGGLLRYADHMGLKKVFEKLERFQSQYGERFKPAPFLVNLVNDQKTFYTHFK